jgi:hypothetical protein
VLVPVIETGRSAWRQFHLSDSKLRQATGIGER